MSTVKSAAKTATATPPAPAPSPATAEKPMVVIDLGKKSKKRIKQLRRGTGRLMDRVVDTVDQLQVDGEVDADAQIVVVVVRQDDGDSYRFWK